MTKEGYEYVIDLWRKAVNDIQDEIMRICPCLSGGRAPNETVEHYAARGMENIEMALRRLAFAKQQYEEWSSLTDRSSPTREKDSPTIVCAMLGCYRRWTPYQDCIQLDMPDRAPLRFCSAKHLALWIDRQKMVSFQAIPSRLIEPSQP